MSVHDLTPGDLFEFRIQSTNERPHRCEMMWSTWGGQWIPIYETAICISCTSQYLPEFELNYLQRYAYLTKSGIFWARVGDGANGTTGTAEGVYIHIL